MKMYLYICKHHWVQCLRNCSWAPPARTRHHQEPPKIQALLAWPQPGRWDEIGLRSHSWSECLCQRPTSVAPRILAKVKSTTHVESTSSMIHRPGTSMTNSMDSFFHFGLLPLATAVLISVVPCWITTNGSMLSNRLSVWIRFLASRIWMRHGDNVKP